MNLAPHHTAAGASSAHHFTIPEAEQRQASFVVGMLFVVYLVSSVDRSIFGILAQPIKEELLLADWQLGFLIGPAFSLVHLLFGLPMAHWTDKGNRVGILTACIALWSIMTAMSGLAVNFVTMALARMGVGIGEAACLPASHSLISDNYPPMRRTKALATFGLGFPAGSLVGMAAGGMIMDHWGWRAAFFVVGLPGLLVALLTWKLVKEPPRGRYDVPASESASIAQPVSFKDVALLMWRSPVVRQMIVGLTLYICFTSPTSTFLGPYLVRRFPISYTELGWIMVFAMMLPASISTYAGGVIVQRLGQWDQRWIMWFPGITIAAGAPFYVVALAQSELFNVTIWMFFGALLNATFLAPCYTVVHNTIPPGGRAKAVVIVGLFMGLIGSSLGPLVAGAANDLLAGQLFGTFDPRGFLAACPGGQGAPGAPEALDTACKHALRDATQWVMMASMALTVWPGIHFYLSGRDMHRRTA